MALLRLATSAAFVCAGAALALAGCALTYDFATLSAGEESALASETGAAADAEPDRGAPAFNGVDASAPTDAALTDASAEASACTVVTAGPLLPRAATLASNGVPWSTPARAQAEDLVGAVASLSAASDESSFLLVRDLGFALPATATVRGVRVSVTGKATASDPQDVRDEELQLAVGGVIAGANLGNTKWSSVFTTRDYGGPTNLWGNTLTPAIVNDPQFGAAFRAKYHGGATGTAEVDVITVTVYYCP